MAPYEIDKTTDPVLRVQDVHVSFQGRPILQGVNLDVHAGETVVILGGSGCGKSTLLRTIVGTVLPTRGKVEVLGRSFAELTPAQLDEHRTKVGILFQSGALFQSMTVGENIAVVLREHYPLSAEEIDIMVTMKLEMVGLRHAKDLLPAEISGGMRKRVALARTLALDPQVMLYDEPGAGLDPVTLAGVDRMIGTFGKALGMASVVVTHRMESALKIAHRMIFLHGGQVLVEGTPEELEQSSDPYLQQFLAGSCDGPIGDETDEDDYAAALLGSELFS
ncbi:MAG: ABC transporter ATP-binding protein [Planctomycetota bacterium]